MMAEGDTDLQVEQSMVGVTIFATLDQCARAAATEYYRLNALTDIASQLRKLEGCG